MTNNLEIFNDFSSGCSDSSDDLRDNGPPHCTVFDEDEEEEAVGQKDQPQCPVHSRQRKIRYKRN